MVNVLRCATDFLEKSYDSMNNPIQLWIPPTMPAAGELLPDFSLGHCIGFTKSLAMKAILLACSEAALTDTELQSIQTQLQALFGFRATVRTTGNAKFDRFRALQDKFAEAARPRPDPIQVSTLLMAQAKDEGLVWTECASAMIQEFNGGSSNEAKRLSEMEASLVTIYPTLSKDTQELIDYHWQLYPPQRSAIPYKAVAVDVFFAGAKLKTGVKSDLWQSILQADNRKRHWYIRRKVQMFLFKLQDARRLRKKINLTTGASALRDQKDPESAWGISAIFAHFLPEMQKLVTPTQLETLQVKFARGYLDAELLEKFRVMTPKLQVQNFRFLADVGVKVLASVSQSQNSESEADLQLQKAEFAKATAKVKKEVMQWNSYQEKKDEFQRTGVTIQAEIADKEKDRQRKAVENCQDELYPIREVLELPHGMTFAEASLQKFKDEHRIPDDSMYRVFWMNPTVLGYDAVRGCEIAVASVATAVAEEYTESSVLEATEKIKAFLNVPEHRLIVRECLLAFDQNSIPPQSQRPGFHKFFVAISDLSNKEGQLFSHFAQSSLWKRQMLPIVIKNTVTPVPMLAIKSMVDPRRGFSSSMATSDTSNKPARRKQWIAGYPVPAAFHDALWQGMRAPDNAGAAWIDVFAYDHSLPEALMRRRASPSLPAPQTIYVGIVWADCNSRDCAHKEKGTAVDPRVQNAKIAKWLQSAIRRKLQSLAQEKVISIKDWVPLSPWKDTRDPPVLVEKDFVALFPGAAQNLPLRETFLNDIEDKLKDEDLKKQWMTFVQEHNDAWNKSGKPHVNSGEKRGCEGDSNPSPGKKARVLTPESESPQTLEALTTSEGPICQIDSLDANCTVIFTNKGHIWVHAKKDVELDSKFPLALAYGKFKVNEDRFF
ncbi:unnamed protein product [Symbiodinium natans]|uniref:Uncharacterized protein n=1 Tax=Symbiodinium natans TaxID=878477 RepID=A0A812VBQ4_9DINO|nr:unnamed protein product [Symbiodinium natans]